MIESARFTLNNEDVKKWLKDVAFFFIVPLTFYVTSVLTIIQLPNHILSVKDFIPNNATMISIVAWILNQIYNLLRKWVKGDVLPTNKE